MSAGHQKRQSDTYHSAKTLEQQARQQKKDSFTHRKHYLYSTNASQRPTPNPGSKGGIHTESKHEGKNINYRLRHRETNKITKATKKKKKY